MSKESNDGPIILVVEDVEETRDGIERLLKVSGYQVDPARDEQDAVVQAHRNHPNLILVSLAGPPADVISAASRIRERAELSEEVPVVIFCIEPIEQGAEVDIGANVYITRPDNFNQLRGFLRRLLHKPHLRPDSALLSQPSKRSNSFLTTR